MKTIKRQTLFIVIVMVMIIATLTACGSGETLSGRFNAEVAGMDFGAITGGLEFFLEFDGKNVTLNVPGFNGTVRYTIDGDTITLRDNDLAQAGWNMRINADRTQITMGGMPGFETVFILEGHETSAAAPAEPPAALSAEPPVDIPADTLAPTPEPTPEEYEIVFADLSLPILVQNKVVCDFPLNPPAMRITSKGTLLSGTQSGWPLAWEWETIATNVRSVWRIRPGDGQLIMWITNDNDLWGVGINRNGILGDGTGVDRDDPVLILDNVATVHLFGREIAYAIQTDGTLWTWGAGNFSPVQIAKDVAHIIQGVNFGRGALGVDFHSTNGGIYRLASDGTIERRMEQPVLEVTPDLTLFINAEHTLIRRTETSRMVGQGLSIRWVTDTTYEEIATEVKSVFPAGANTFFVTFDGTLWGVGANSNGELGDGTRVPRDEPIRLAENVVYARAHAFLKQDGTLWTWEQNDPTPQQTLENVATVSGYNIHFRDGRMLRNFFAQHSQSELSDVKIPQTFTFVDGVITSAYPELVLPQPYTPVDEPANDETDEDYENADD